MPTCVDSISSLKDHRLVAARRHVHNILQAASQVNILKKVPPTSVITSADNVMPASETKGVAKETRARQAASLFFNLSGKSQKKAQVK